MCQGTPDGVTKVVKSRIQDMRFYLDYEIFLVPSICIFSFLTHSKSVLLIANIFSLVLVRKS